MKMYINTEKTTKERKRIIIICAYYLSVFKGTYTYSTYSAETLTFMILVPLCLDIAGIMVAVVVDE